MNRMIPALLVATVAAVPAAAQDWSHAARVEVRLANFSYTPKTIHLKAGQPVVLHLVNTASGGHDFTAPGFFAAAQVRPQDRGLIEEGSVEFAGRQSHDIALVPKAGHYSLKCDHSFHKMFGMSGAIVVD
ncbi:MAG: cupredoxin domain-containing protein [Alphaproteobacteria bacterium]|nr:cupredoxin domain-containing protein [Alphaproteobacteria bacterium]MBV9371845.1 cupredoxin domain-containing protein [Alphaproteobacteria bacterium]MBV9901292.1 cupredoxin domain-containing protein [Alphaproteobacteria bacterium]